MLFPSVKINDIDMLKTYRMALKDRHCVQPPVPKTSYLDIPGADGSMDLSTVNSGHVVYEFWLRVPGESMAFRVF